MTRVHRAWIWLGLLALTFAALVGLIAAVGTAMPVTTGEAGSLEIAAPPERVFGVLVGFANYPSWNPLYERSELMAGNHAQWTAKLRGENRMLIFQVDESEPSKRLVLRVANNHQLPFGARIIYSLRPVEKGCQVRMSLQGEVYNPVLRFFTHRVYGPRQTIQTTLRALKQHAERGS